MKALPAAADAWVVLLAILVISILLIIRMFSQGQRVRRLLAISSVMVAGSAVLAMCGIVYIATRPFTIDPDTIPYEKVGSYSMTDLNGNPCQITVDVKELGVVTPPGALPRVKLVAVSKNGRDTKIYDTHWRFGLASVRPADGGIEVLSQLSPEKGLRFLIRNGRWQSTPEDLSQAKSHP